MASRLIKIAHGAEAILFKTMFLGYDAVVKIREEKPYRHPVYDRSFRLRRTITEAKVVSQLKMLGLNVPALFFIDLSNYMLVMEYINGSKLSDIIQSLSEDYVEELASKLGIQAAIMHKNKIYHGDFTLANIIISKGEPYIIDFGLSGYSTDIEEYAIDIHLLMRSIEALAPEKAEVFMTSFWRGYCNILGKEFCRSIKERVSEIRLRGRYIEESLRRKIRHERYM